MSAITEKELYLFEEYPLTELKRIVDKAISEGADDFKIEKVEYYGNEEYFLRTYKRNT